MDTFKNYTSFKEDILQALLIIGITLTIDFVSFGVVWFTIKYII